MKSAVLVGVLALIAFAALEESAAARTYLNCVTKKVVIVDVEENLGVWIDERQKLSRPQMGRSSMLAALMTAGLVL
jgi:hypothetical protein